MALQYRDRGGDSYGTQFNNGMCEELSSAGVVYSEKDMICGLHFEKRLDGIKITY